jgi:predicted acetyltransferase
MGIPKLVEPSEKYKESYLTALLEFHLEARNLEWSIQELQQDFTILLHFLKRMQEGIGLPDGDVPWTQYWLVEGSQYLGRVNIRHTLSESLRRKGGNIGYQIRPSARGRGLGNRILELALPVAREKHGLRTILVTCHRMNIPSRKIILRCGGLLEEESTYLEELRFWIPESETRI